MSNALDNARLKRLTYTILKNPSASARKEALLEIRKIDDPQVVELLEQVAKDDKDAEVRDLAGNLLSKRRIQSRLEEGTFEDTASVSDWESDSKFDNLPPLLPPDFDTADAAGDSAFESVDELKYHTVADESRWICRFCDTENEGGHYCDNCSAHRGDTEITAPPVHRPREFQPDGDTFLLHTANRKVLMGKPHTAFKIAGSGLGCGLFFMIPFILAGIFVAAFMIKEWRDYQLLSNEGVTANGTYVSRRYDDDDDGTTYYATYRFQAYESTYENEHSVDWDIYNRVEPGAPVQVVYASSNPGISRIQGTDGIETALFLTVFTVCWNLISWGIFLGMLIGYGRDRRLAREGKLVTGELLAATGRKDSDGDFQLKVEYSFLAPDTEEVIFKTENAQRNNLKNADLPRRGTPVAVMYRNRTHFRML